LYIGSAAIQFILAILAHHPALVSSRDAGCATPAGLSYSGSAAIVFLPVTGSNGYVRTIACSVEASDNTHIAYGQLEKQERGAPPVGRDPSSRVSCDGPDVALVAVREQGASARDAIRRARVLQPPQRIQVVYCLMAQSTAASNSW
jgi:hypothetical protein